MLHHRLIDTVPIMMMTMEVTVVPPVVIIAIMIAVVIPVMGIAKLDRDARSGLGDGSERE